MGCCRLNRSLLRTKETADKENDRAKEGEMKRSSREFRELKEMQNTKVVLDLGLDSGTAKGLSGKAGEI